MNTCSTCRFYLGGISLCRRYPPQDFTEYVYPVGDTTYSYRNSSHAMVEPTGWCGEWKGIPPCRCSEGCQCSEIKKILEDSSL